MEYTREEKLAATADATTLNHCMVATRQQEKLTYALRILPWTSYQRQADPHLAVASCQTHPQCNVDEA